jgi:hypothetical protein
MLLANIGKYWSNKWIDIFDVYIFGQYWSNNNVLNIEFDNDNAIYLKK